ncbi:unnamed protein product [Schistocephalus solidus]|uniref:Peptidase_S26 domain-containing protein n=1 Tax=Schistocephalus solidus TaxID=70667 RepID=A0A183T9I2_SCHSO|nr:unnamed protein product [Schistocephalus solidus]
MMPNPRLKPATNALRIERRCALRTELYPPPGQALFTQPYPVSSDQDPFVILDSTRTSPGVQIVWGDLNGVTAAQKWNPLCRNIPCVVLTHHPLIVKQNQLPPGQSNVAGAGYGTDTTAGTLYDVNNFLLAIRDACSSGNVEFKTGDIIIESYGNIGSVVFNQTCLGFTRAKVPVVE